MKMQKIIIGSLERHTLIDVRYWHEADIRKIVLMSEQTHSPTTGLQVYIRALVILSYRSRTAEVLRDRGDKHRI
jgi:hypothetical protein